MSVQIFPEFERRRDQPQKEDASCDAGLYSDGSDSQRLAYSPYDVMYLHTLFIVHIVYTITALLYRVSDE